VKDGGVEQKGQTERDVQVFGIADDEVRDDDCDGKSIRGNARRLLHLRTCIVA
jgi:hypothetical protein